MTSGPVKVLYVLSNLRKSGPVNVLRNIIRHLDTERYSPHILTLSPESSDSDRDSFVDLGVSLHSLNRGHLQGLFEGSALSRMISEVSPAVLHTHGFRSDFLTAWSPYRFKTVSTLHNDPYQDYPRKFGIIKGTLMGVAHLLSLRRIAKVVACSESIGLVAKRYGLSVRSVCNGVDTDIYFPDPSLSRYELRKKLGLPISGRIFLSVASIIERKNPLALVKGFLNSECMEKDTLVVLGDGPLRGACEKLAGDRNCIHFSGAVDNVIDYLRASDVFISTSNSEGLPNAVLEAMSCGLPVVLSDIPSHREILDVQPEAGFIFPVGDFEALAKCIDEIGQADRATMGKLASATVANRFNAARMSQEYQNLYMEMIE